ncbi:MAG: hypothetical protein IJJ33_01285, partial [Victivallales bacterium]|nr:hypothetical protein [Victivallales bacterium]
MITRYSKIPGGDAFARRLNSSPEPIRPVKSRRKANEVNVARFSVAYEGDSPAVLCALEDLQCAAARLKGAALPLHLKCDNAPGRSRKHTLEVAGDAVRIQAETPFGLARAIRRLTARLALRRAPFLERGRWTAEGTLDPALTHPAFKESGLFTLEWPQAYQPGYLWRVAAAGYTGFHLNVCLYAFCRSKICPELDAPDGEAFLRDLAAITKAAGEVGLDIYLSLYLHPLKGDHPVFLAHPEMRGSRMVASDTHYVPCCSSGTSLAFYAEQMRRLFTAVPELGGILALAGCEGWLHCFTANAPDSCPNCTGKQREPLVAHMYNTMATAVKQASPQARFIVWTYGLFAWTDIGGREFIRHLRPPVEVMANFDTGEDFRLCGATGTRFDYSLSCVGPSRPFLEQKAAAKAAGLLF